MVKPNKILRILLILLVITMVPSLALTSPVRAQSTVLAISPTSSTVSVCNDPVDTIITVKVQDVENLFAYDVSVSFTPGAIEVVELSNGGFLDSGFVLRNVINNTTGMLRFAMTQQSPSTAKNGSGDLISIHIHALTPGSTVAMTIVTNGGNPSKLSASGGVPIPFTASSGSFTILDTCHRLLYLCLILR